MLQSLFIMKIAIEQIFLRRPHIARQWEHASLTDGQHFDDIRHDAHRPGFRGRAGVKEREGRALIGGLTNLLFHALTVLPGAYYLVDNMKKGLKKFL